MMRRSRRWTAIVKAWEPFLAPVLQGRLDLHATRYRGAHDDEGRGWITLDGEQILSFESLSWMVRTYGLAAEVEAVGESVDDAWAFAQAVAGREGVVPLWAFEEAVAHYPERTVEEALAAPEPMVRGLAMLDRRLGKRRLAVLELNAEENPVVRRLLQVRLDAEGLTRPSVGTGAGARHG